MRADLLRECTRLLLSAADRIGDDVADRLRILLICQQVRCDSGWTRHEQVSEPCPSARWDRTLVDSHIGAARLLASGHGELVCVRREVAELEERSGRSVRHGPLVGSAFPRRHGRRELEPRGVQVQVVRRGYDDESVHPPREALQEATVCDESLPPALRDACPRRLSARDQALLLGSKVRESADRRSSCHYCAIPHNWGLTTY